MTMIMGALNDNQRIELLGCGLKLECINNVEKSENWIYNDPTTKLSTIITFYEDKRIRIGGSIPFNLLNEINEVVNPRAYK